MATVINTPGAESAAGWAVAVIVLVAAVLVGLFVWPGLLQRAAPAPAETNPGTNVEVQLPATGGEQGGTGGTQPSPQTPQTPPQY